LFTVTFALKKSSATAKGKQLSEVGEKVSVGCGDGLAVGVLEGAEVGSGVGSKVGW